MIKEIKFKNTDLVCVCVCMCARARYSCQIFFYKRYLKSTHDVQQRAKQEGVLRMHLKWPGNLILLRNSSRRLSPVPGSVIYQDTSLTDTNPDRPNLIYGPNYTRCFRPDTGTSNRLEIPEFEPGFDRNETLLRLQSNASQLQILHKEGEDGTLDSVAECGIINKNHKLINSTISDSTGIKEKLLVNGNNIDTNMHLNNWIEALENVGSRNESTSSELVIDTWHESLRNEIGYATQSTTTLSNGTILPRVRRQGICFPVPKVHYETGSVMDCHDNWLKTPFRWRTTR